MEPTEMTVGGGQHLSGYYSNSRGHGLSPMDKIIYAQEFKSNGSETHSSPVITNTIFPIPEAPVLPCCPVSTSAQVRACSESKGGNP